MPGIFTDLTLSLSAVATISSGGDVPCWLVLLKAEESDSDGEGRIVGGRQRGEGEIAGGGSFEQECGTYFTPRHI